MDLKPRSTESSESRLEWIEPEVRHLDMSETASAQTTGGDGERTYADCTLS